MRIFSRKILIFPLISLSLVAIWFIFIRSPSSSLSSSYKQSFLQITLSQSSRYGENNPHSLTLLQGDYLAGIRKLGGSAAPSSKDSRVWITSSEGVFRLAPSSPPQTHLYVFFSHNGLHLLGGYISSSVSPPELGENQGSLSPTAELRWDVLK